MKLITRDTDYALQAICFIAQQKGKIVSVSDLVKGLKMPRPFLRKVLQVLNREGVLRSHKGKGGGFIVGKPVKAIRLVDLIKIFQGSFQLNECFFRKMKCPNVKTCALRKRVEIMENYIASELESITIASLLR